ncbi:sialate O-acetylesterase-like [Neocloeon triangulifer]|uniref:sialate O-acetylesterase-like n=1 Tax=Neocloeon triangulifer TaxID=2078957 RepID=UPI00286EDF5B|nr:sialate O-acetylesterase-like [Neocloeon triangulifer]
MTTPHPKFFLIFFIASTLLCASHSFKADHKFPPDAPTPEYQFRFGHVFTKGAVLQMAPKRAQIWGFGRPFSEIVLAMNNGKKHFTTVHQNGLWSILLEPQAVGGPHIIRAMQFSLTVNTQPDTIQLENVMFGDVWLCAGGSNMAQELNDTMNADKIMSSIHAARNSNVRMLQISREFSEHEQDDVKVSREWAHAGPDDNDSDSLSLLAYLPALCLLYGMKMAEFHPGRPIGMVEAAWGGTPIEAWGSQRVTEVCHTKKSKGHLNQYSNHVLWNGMIHPLTKMTIRGVIWHQGEANTEYNREKYACHLTKLVTDWRNRFSEGSVRVPLENDIAFPFGVVQLGPSLSERHASWSELRLGQMGGWLHDKAHQIYLPNSRIPEGFMAAAYDLADPPELTTQTSFGVHYRDKATVAERLALASQALLHNESLPHYGPHIIRIEYDNENWTANLTFDRPIRVDGNTGFLKQLATGEWVETPILITWARGVVLALSEGQGLSYGQKTEPCPYKKCSIYSDDIYRLPALLFKDYFNVNI